MTLLTICQGALEEITSVEVPGSIVNNDNEAAVEALALAKREIRDLKASGHWQELVTEQTFSTAASDADYALPSDFAYIINGTMWDRTNQWQLHGPRTLQEWQQLKSGIVSIAARSQWTIYGDQILIYPTPSDVRTIAFNYVSSHAVLDTDGTTTKETWAADTDTCRLSEDLVQMGIVWRWRKAKGYDWQSDFELYRDYRNKLIGRQPKPEISFDRPSVMSGLNFNYPDGNFTL